MSFVIITDTNCELNKELRERFGLDDMIPGHIVTPDGQDHLCDTDWILFKSPEEFYSQLRDKKKTFSTSPASVEEFKICFKKHLEKGEDVIYLALSSALSGTYNFACMAKTELEQEGVKGNVYIVDTLRYSVAISLLVVKANELRKAGKSAKETFEWLEENKNKVHEMGPMDDLFFLSRKGRVSFGAAFMGTMVGVKPMGDFNNQGMTTVLTKVLGTKKMIETTVEYIKRTIVNPEEQIIFIANTDRRKNAELIKERLLQEIKVKEVIMVDCGPTSGTNIGPGLAVAFYFGNNVSEGNAEETKVMNAITGK